MKKARLQRMIANMEQVGLSQMILSAPASIYYLTGQWIEPHERMLALYIDANGSAVFFANKLFAAKEDADFQLVEYDDTVNPVLALAENMKAGSLGIDKAWPSRFLIDLMQMKPNIQPMQGSPVVDQTRMYKDQEEMEALRKASELNDRVMAHALSHVEEGMTEMEVCKIIDEQYTKGGAIGTEAATLACFGAGGAEPHHDSDTTRLKAGDGILIDTGKPLDRYYSDMTRTVFFRSATDEQKKVYDLVRRANRAGIDAVRPGVKLADIDRAARSVIEEAGYGAYFTHRLGHGIGLEIHEPPDVSSVSEAIAQPGMAFTIEPGIYLADQFGVRVEDVVMVTEEGVDVLNHHTKELQIIE